MTAVRSAHHRLGRPLAAAFALVVLLAGCGSLAKSAGATRAPGGQSAKSAVFTATTGDGTTVRLPSDKPTVLLFFSVECGGCGPTANALAKARAADPTAADYAVIDVASHETPKDVERFLAANDAKSLPTPSTPKAESSRPTGSLNSAP